MSLERPIKQTIKHLAVNVPKMSTHFPMCANDFFYINNCMLYCDIRQLSLVILYYRANNLSRQAPMVSISDKRPDAQSAPRLSCVRTRRERRLISRSQRLTSTCPSLILAASRADVEEGLWGAERPHIG